MKLSEEQIAYLKGLDSKKKQRKFLLDCFVDNLIDEFNKNYIITLSGIKKISDLPSENIDKGIEELKKIYKCHDEQLFTNTTAPRTFENRQEYSTKDYDFEKGIKESIEMRIPHNPEAKYTEEDMNEYALFIHKNYVVTPSEWFEKFKKEKENE